MSLFPQLCSIKTLHRAWTTIKQKNSAGGIDGLTVAEYDANLGKNLEELRKELLQKQWQPEPYLRVEIQKKKKEGERRKLGLLTIKDKIVQQAIKLLIEDKFENLFLNNSYGYRPEKGHTKAIKRSMAEINNKKHKWILRLDIDDYFDTIKHELLFSRLKSIILDEEILRLIELCVKMGVVGKTNKWEENSAGLPQGAVLSPILANYYLHPFDQFITSKNFGYVRYADDFIILCDTQEQAQEMLLKGNEFLENRLFLKCNEPEITPTEQGVEFLGVIIKPNGISISEKKKVDLTERINNIKLDGATISPKSIELLRGIKRYYGVLLPDSYLLELDNILIARISQLIKDNSSIFSNQSAVKAVFNHIEFFLPTNIANKKNLMNMIVQQYAQIKQKQKNTKDSKQDNKKIIEAKKREYRKREGECSEIVITKPGSFIHVNKKGLSVKNKGVALLQAPWAGVEHITVMSQATSISTQAIKLCMKNKIPIDFFDGKGKLYGSVLSPSYVENTCWEKQANLPAKRKTDIGVAIITGKLKNQMSLIKYFHKYHKGLSDDLNKCYDKSIQIIEKQVEALKVFDAGIDNYREKLISIEAGAAVAYWEYVRTLIADDEVEFATRERKGAKDLMNCLLNYGYAILYGRVWKALLQVGLNPSESVIHVKQPGNPTFVYDVIELFRAQAVDRVVISLIQKGEPLQIKDGLLNESTRSLLIKNLLERWSRYEKYRGEDIKFTTIIVKQAKEIALFIDSEENKYKPYVSKW